MIRLVLIDVDGTLVGRDGIHHTTPEALRRVRHSGVQLGLSTGRLGVGMAEQYARTVDPDGLHIFQSGAVISRPGSAAEHTTALPPNAVQQLVDLSRRVRQPLELYTEREIWVDQVTPAVSLHCKHLGVDAKSGDLLNLHVPAVSAVWAIPETAWEATRRATTQIGGLLINAATAPWAPGMVFANITRTGTSKASALQWLAQRLGLLASEVAMIGDGHNDADALEIAGLAIAMGEAPPSVRQLCDVAVAPADHGGLAQALNVILGSP